CARDWGYSGGWYGFLGPDSW
nr:immunoglobulin heavy chain junction region [Macaca mulatta]